MLDFEPPHPFAVQLAGTDKFLRVHRGRNGLPDGRLSWGLAQDATWFETREGAGRWQRRLVGEKTSIYAAENYSFR